MDLNVNVVQEKPITESELARKIERYYTYPDDIMYTGDGNGKPNIEYLFVEIKLRAKAILQYMVESKFSRFKFLDADSWSHEQKARAVNSLLNSKHSMPGADFPIDPMEWLFLEIDLILADYQITLDTEVTKKLNALLNSDTLHLNTQKSVAKAIAAKITGDCMRISNTFNAYAQDIHMGTELQRLKDTELSEYMKKFIDRAVELGIAA